MRVITVRKNHYCEDPECRGIILKGEKAKVLTRKYNRRSGTGHYFETYYFHLNCNSEGF